GQGSDDLAEVIQPGGEGALVELFAERFEIALNSIDGLSGIISVANRVIGGRLYLQTTTQINPGNSGGPLFNLKGEVVGVNNMKIAAVGAEGLGFSISSRTLKSFLDNLEAYAFDPRNPNSGFRYLNPPSIPDAVKNLQKD
ncbi:MAG: trypsin-like peptidase domain-containing protein, partial [Opitutales bacterium]